MELPVLADSGQQLAQRDQARPGNRDGHGVVLIVSCGQHVVTEGQREAVRVLVHQRGVGSDVHDETCAVIQARTSPTLKAVTRSESLMGFGNVPAFTLRHSVGAEKGRGAGVSGLLGLCTSCASRMKALSGSASKTD